MLDLKDRYGATIVVPVIFSETSSGYELNIVPSMYPKVMKKQKCPVIIGSRSKYIMDLFYIKIQKKCGIGPELPSAYCLGGIPIPTNKRYILKLI